MARRISTHYYDEYNHSKLHTNGIVPSNDPITMGSLSRIGHYQGNIRMSLVNGVLIRGTPVWDMDVNCGRVMELKQERFNINGGGTSDPYSFTIVGDTLYFSAMNNTHGRELWKTDGLK